MIARIVAWVIVLAVCGVIWQYGSRWKSPWALPVASPVLSQLPPAHGGCAEACK
jgi:hypothetical protein